ncbi:lipase family protein [Sorangium sp. So ce388]|uniref:lipase family protein n=1 Tax=Sorangium sp. So ce388 TaxID=3133309 RepID=UPI003F5BFF49
MKIVGFKVPSTGRWNILGAMMSSMTNGETGFSHWNAYLLSLLSSWAYADTETFASRIADAAGFQCAVLQTVNDALVLNNAAYLIQSQDKNTIILCFRGSMPRNSINFWSNANVRLEPSFLFSGNIHSGFSRSVHALWPWISKLLEQAFARKDLCEAVEQLNKQQGVTACSDEDAAGAETSGSARGPAETGTSTDTRATDEKKTAPKLYITGHSLGGALAALAAALLFGEQTPIFTNLGQYRDSLAGVYTFGQPMVGDRFFADWGEKKFGSKCFRMVYKNDFVARMPPRTMGNFQHFGVRYNSSDIGWVLSPQPQGAARSFVLTSLLAGLGLIATRVPALSWFSLVRALSFEDHEPFYYMQTSAKVHHPNLLITA